MRRMRIAAERSHKVVHDNSCDTQKVTGETAGFCVLYMDMGLALLAMVLLWLLRSGLLDYLGGRHNQVLTLQFLLIVVTLIILLGLLLVRGLVPLGKQRFRVAVIRLSVFLSLSLLTAVAWNFHEPSYIAFTRGFRERIRAEADLRSIRAWQSTLTGSPGGQIDPSLWPNSVERLRPSAVLISPNGDSIKIVFGSGFGHWGLTVGSEAMSFRATSDREYVLPIEPGAYAWHEIQ